MDRFHLVEAAQLPQLGASAAYFQAVEEKLLEHKQYIWKHSDDMPEIAGWRGTARRRARLAAPRPRATTYTGGDS